MTSPYDQSQYQVRFDWGSAGALRVATDVDALVIVDALVTAPPVLEFDTSTPAVVGSLRNRTAVARWVLERQAEKADRFSVAILAVGEQTDGGLRFCVEDQLAAGGIVDALADLGIDYCSPEAAAACAVFTGLRTGIRHLVNSSGSGLWLAAQGRLDEVDAACELDVSSTVAPFGEFRGR